MTCPCCGHPATKALYAGLPMRLCASADCHFCWGGFSFLFKLGLPFNGWFIRVVGQFESSKPANSSKDHTWSAIPACIAGVTRKV